MGSNRAHGLARPTICGLTLLSCGVLMTGAAHAGGLSSAPMRTPRRPNYQDAQDLLWGGEDLAPCLAVAVGDLSGNGYPDLVVATETGLEIFLNENSPEGNLFRRQDQNLLLVPTWVQDVAVADLNGDGLPDILAAAPDRTYLFRNLGNAVFQDGGSTPGSDLNRASHGQNLCLVDLDGDQDLDLLIARSTHGGDQALLNDGQGNFSDQYSLPLLAYTQTFESHQSQSFHTGDLDGDGDPDLLALRHVGFPAFYIENSGSYTFQLETERMIPFMESDRMRSAAIADFDGNGTLDIYLAVEGGYGDRLYGRLEHSAIFNHLQALSPIGNNLLFSHTCIARDFNQDGRTDVATFSLIKSLSLGRSIRRTVLLVNTHFGRDELPSFSAQALPRAGPAAQTNALVTDIAALDLNQDGRPDLVQTVHISGTGGLGRGTGGIALLLHTGYDD